MLYDWSMESNYYSNILGSKINVVCARVGGANTIPYLFSVVHFAEQKISNYFLLLQNMNSGDKKEKVQKPARIPPQTPPAGGKSAEAGRKSFPPDKLFRPAESALVILIIWILLEIHSNFVQYTPRWL